MRRATAGNMRNAFGSECASRMRYLVFSERAEIEKFPNMARLFRAFAFSDEVHASGHYRQTSELLGEYCISFSAPFIYGRTMDNLVKTCETEREESEELYLPFAAAAEAQGEKRAARDFERIAQARKLRSEMARKALDYIEHAAEEPEMGEIYVCGVCGLAVEGGPPESCPVCMAERSGFKPVD
jgi:rubrerythrin